MGLLDQFTDFINTPGGQGLLSAGLGALGSRTALGGISRGGLLGLQAYTGAQDRKLQQDQQTKHNQLFDIQLAQARQAQTKQQAIQDLTKQFAMTPAQNAMGATAQAGDQAGGFDGMGGFAPGVKNVGPTLSAAAAIPSQKPSFNYAGYADALAGVDPAAALSLKASLAKDSQINKFDVKDFDPVSVAKFAQTNNYADLVRLSKKEIAPSGQVYDPYGVKPGTVFNDPNAPFGIGADGKPVANTGYQSFQLAKSKAGATNVSVKNDVKMGESLASQVGPMVKDSYVAAQGAAQSADSANRLIKAVDSNKLITGPFANGRLAVSQLSDTLGIGGKDNQEKLNNTRAAIRSLSELTLNGRKQMSGQGAITESEGKLAERAMSGDISMTPTELRSLANAARRAAKWTYDQHQGQLRNMRQDPNLTNMSRFYDVAPFPEMPADAPSSPASGAKFLGFE
jgi:hypothetical protein